MVPSFANYVDIGIDEEAVLIQFVFELAQQKQQVALITVAPSLLKRLQRAVDNAVNRYERDYHVLSDGSIEIPGMRPGRGNGDQA